MFRSDILLRRAFDETQGTITSKGGGAVVEAKRQDFDEGWGQCLAAILACQKINDDEQLAVYGIVSSGLVWEFGKLEAQCFTKEPFAHSIDSPQKLAGTLDYLFTECEKQISVAKDQGRIQ